MGRPIIRAKFAVLAFACTIAGALPSAASALTLSLPPLPTIQIGVTTTSPAQPVITAHRGGSIVNGVATYAENTMPGFIASAARGDIVEFDVHVTKDGVPIVIHDDTLDRVTACKDLGAIHTLTFAQIQGCPVNVLGRNEGGLPSAPNPGGTPIPTLAAVLAQMKAMGATISPEIKSIPPLSVPDLLATDFDPTQHVARVIALAIAASGFPQNKVILQSFWPLNLDAARPVLPNAQFSFLTLAALNAIGPTYAFIGGYQWVSPDFSGALQGNYMTQVHQFGKKVTVYTLNTPASFIKAKQMGVDGIITDDPALARSTLGL